jgi:hypothetical protein
LLVAIEAAWLPGHARALSSFLTRYEAFEIDFLVNADYFLGY